MGRIEKYKILFLLPFFINLVLIVPHKAFPSEPIWITCEVLEISKDLDIPSREIGKLHYAVIHHKFQEDRQKLSLWLRKHSGEAIKFKTADGKQFDGVLNRLKMCFGRGLLIYFEKAPLNEKDVIKVLLSQ